MILVQEYISLYVIDILQGRNEVYFFITDSVFLPEIFILDLKNVEKFDL